MTTPFSSMRNLAGRWLAASRSVADPDVHEAGLVDDRLRAALIRFAGEEGFASLQRRALILAKSELPPLQVVQVGENGRLTGFEQLAEDTGAEAAVAITTHLLDLLVNFIGERLTLRLLSEAWPDTVLGEQVQPWRSQ